MWDLNTKNCRANRKITAILLFFKGTSDEFFWCKFLFCLTLSFSSGSSYYVVYYLVCYLKKEPTEVLYKTRCSEKFGKVHRKTTVSDAFLNKVTGLLKKRLWHSYFSMNFAKFLSYCQKESPGGVQ